MAAGVSDRSFSPTLNTSDDEEGYGEREFPGDRTFIDFESEESIPNLTVKTFLLDCCQHPKILLHKEFEFFRSYLCEVGLKFEMPANAPVLENHEDNSFCLDKGDKWLQTLKERVNKENVNDFYWASIIPVRRRQDLGLVMFKWESLPMSIDWLQTYIAYCRSNSQIVNSKADEVLDEDMEIVDDYIKDFLKRFKPDRNMDVEERFKGAKEGSEYRKQNNLKGPSRTDLQHLFRRQPTQRPVASIPGATKKRYLNSDNDTDSSSTSSGSSSGSEYNGKYTVKRHRKTKKRKVVQGNVNNLKRIERTRMAKRAAPFPLPTNGLVNGLRLLNIKIVLERCSIPTRLNEIIHSSVNIAKSSAASKESSISSIAGAIIKKQPTTPSTATGCSTKEKEKPTVLKKPSAPVTTNSSTAKENVINIQANNANSSKKSPPKTPLKFYCEICWFGTSFSTQKLLDRHISTKHSSTKRELITCGCGLRIKEGSIKFHQQFCKKTYINTVKH